MRMDSEDPKDSLEKPESRARLVLLGQRAKKVILGSEVPSDHKVPKGRKEREAFLAPWVPKALRVTLVSLDPKVKKDSKVPKDHRG